MIKACALILHLVGTDSMGITNVHPKLFPRVPDRVQG